MNDIFSNSLYKYISFPQDEFLSKFNKLPDCFDIDFVTEYIIGGFCALLISSELQSDVEILPNWHSTAVSFIYELSSFEVEYLKTLNPDNLKKILENKKYSGSFDFLKDSRKKKIKGNITIDLSKSEYRQIDDIKFCFEINLTLEKPYTPQKLIFSSFSERNDYLLKEIELLKNNFYKSLNISNKKSQTKRTIHYVPDYLSYATASVVQDLRRYVSVFPEKKLELPNYSFELKEGIKTQLYEQVAGMSDLTVDVLNGIVHLWLNNRNNNFDPILVSTDDLLFIRNIKAKLNNKNNRGGYNEKTRQSIAEQIELLSNINIKAENIFPHLKNQTISGESKVLNISKWTKSDNLGGSQFYYLVRPGDVLNMTLVGVNAQIGVIHRKVAEYNHHKNFWEKRLGNYLAWIWRTRQYKNDFVAPLKIKSLLKEIKSELDKSRPSLVKERFENAMDTLLNDGIIKSWQYESIDELIFERKNWIDIWMQLNVLIEPPIDVIKQYSKIKKYNVTNNLKLNPIVSLQNLIEYKRLSQFSVAESLNIEPSLLLKLLNGEISPDSNLLERIEKFVYKD